MTPRRGRTLWAMALLAVGGLVAAALTLSDALPLFTKRAVSEVDPRLDRLISPAFNVGHVLVWAGLAFAAVMLLERARWQLAALACLIVGATALEYAQSFLSTSRHTNLGDAQANLIGVALGAVAGLLLTIDARAEHRSRTP